MPEEMNALEPLMIQSLTVAYRRGADARQVTACARFGHRDRDDGLATGDAGQPALLLLVVGEVLEVRADDVVVQAQRRAVHAGPGDLLVDDRVEPEVIRTAAAELLGHVEPDDAVLARGGVRRPVDDASFRTACVRSLVGALFKRRCLVNVRRSWRF